MICSKCAKNKEKVYDLFGDGLIIVCEQCKKEMIEKGLIKGGKNEENKNCKEL